MSQMPDVRSMLQWLLGENAAGTQLLNPNDALNLAMTLLALAGALLFMVAWRDKLRRDERTRKLSEDERTHSRMRRM